MAVKADQLETKLDNVFEKNAPKLPANAKKMIADWAPWVALIVGVLSLLSAYWLWQAANAVSAYVNLANQVSAAYGGVTTTAANMTLWVWLALLVLVAEGLLYVLAFPGLRARKKAGWNYLYWGALVNVAYALVSLFTLNGAGGFVGALLSSAIGLWLLFQVRSEYKA
jgi:hypothetical protein